MNTDFQDAYDAGANTKIVSTEIGGVPHILVPNGASLASFERLLPAPTRIVASPEFCDVAGFLDYTAEFAERGTRVYVSNSDWRFFTVFDSHAPGSPAWGDHCASLALVKSPEWKRFLAQDGKKMTPMELAEFIEENLEYFTGPIEGADLLTMAQNLKVQLKGDLQIEHSTQSGLKQLLIRDDSVLRGTKGEKSLAFPEKVTLSLRVFDQNMTYEISVFLRYRATSEGVMFWFKIADPDGIEEAAFDLVVEDVKKTSGLKTLRGRYEGPKHK